MISSESSRPKSAAFETVTGQRIEYIVIDKNPDEVWPHPVESIEILRNDGFCIITTHNKSYIEIPYSRLISAKYE